MEIKMAERIGTESERKIVEWPAVLPDFVLYSFFFQTEASLRYG